MQSPARGTDKKTLRKRTHEKQTTKETKWRHIRK